MGERDNLISSFLDRLAEAPDRTVLIFLADGESESARQADGLRACLIWLFAADTDRAHD